MLNGTQRGFGAGKLLGTGFCSWLDLKADIIICLSIIFFLKNLATYADLGGAIHTALHVEIKSR